jgi:hypothetical protein
MTVQQASSQQLLFPLDLFFQATEMELIEELKLALVNTGFVLKTLVKIIISGTVNVTESEVSLVLEQLLSDFPTVVLVKMIRLQNPWQKFSCKNRDSTIITKKLG